MSVTVSIGTGSGGLGTSTADVEIRMDSTNTGYRIFNLPTLSNANSPCTSRALTFSVGINSITVPTKAGAFFLILDPTNTTVTATYLGTDNTDTGTPINVAGWIGLAFTSSPPSTIYVTTSGTLTAEIVFY